MTKEKDQQFQKQIQKCLNDNKESLQGGYEKLGIDQKELLDAIKSKKSFESFISNSINQAEGNGLISSDEKQKLTEYFKNFIREAEKQNLVDFGKGKDNTSENDEILSFAEAQQSNRDNIREQIEGSWQAAQVENLYMRAFFSSLNELCKTIFHAAATYNYADTVKNQQEKNANDSTDNTKDNTKNENDEAVPKNQQDDQQNENQERENRLNKRQSFKNGNIGNMGKIMVKKLELDKKQQEICENAGIEKPEGLEAAIQEKDVATVNDAIAILQDFLKKLDQKKKEEVELTTNLIAFLQEKIKAIQQREQTKKQLNTGKNKPKNTVEELFNNLKSLEKAGVSVSWLSQPQGKEQEKQIVTNKGALDVTKKMVEVRFKNDKNSENDTVLHVHPTGISVPDPKYINEKSIPQIAKTIQATGAADVKINKEEFPEENRDKLVQQLTDALKKLNINVVNRSEETQKEEVQQEDTDKNTLKQ